MRFSILVLYLTLTILTILPPTTQVLLKTFADPILWWNMWKDAVKPDEKHPMYPPRIHKPRPTIEERAEPTSMPTIVPRKGGGSAGARGSSVGLASTGTGRSSSGEGSSSNNVGRTGSSAAAAGAGALAGGAGGAMLGALAGGGGGGGGSNQTTSNAISGSDYESYKICLGFLVWAVGMGVIV